MAYNPSDLRPGDVILVAIHPWQDILADLITFATASPYTHAVLVGDGHLIESVAHVTRSPLSKYTHTGDAFSVLATGDQKQAAIEVAEARVGTPYGTSELLDDAARYFLHLPAVYPWNARRQTCSGFVAYAFRKSGVPLSFAPDPSPADLSYSPLLVGSRPWVHK